MREISVKVHAKVNLSLYITGVRGSMHLLDSVIASVGLCDELDISFALGGEDKISFESENGDVNIPADNTVSRALGYLREFEPRLSACVRVKKGIPLEGGLGGSSADAAAVIASAVYAGAVPGGAEEIVAGSVKVGSDVPCMCKGGILRISGIGEKITELPFVPLRLVIASGGGGVSTKEAYRVYDEICGDFTRAEKNSDTLISALKSGDAAKAASAVHNSLTEASVRLCDSIAPTLKAIEDSGALASFMTGSGSYCAGIYRSKEEAEAAARSLREAGFYAVSTETVERGVEFLRRVDNK